MSKDTSDCEVMNELFDSGEPIHWKPVAIYNDDGTKIRDITKKEQLEWIKNKRNWKDELVLWFCLRNIVLHNFRYNGEDGR